jgi:DNA-binding response OmpR family regulator
MIKVLLVDDDLELIEMIEEYLEKEGFAVTVVHDGEAGVAEALSSQYAIAVLDVMMPGLSGVEVLRRIRKKSPMPLLMLTAKGDDIDRIIGLELGADDYVPKPCTPRELTARMRAILRRTHIPAADDASQAPLVVGQLVVRPAQRRAEWAGQALELTSVEFTILELLARNAGRPVSKKELSELGLGRPLVRFDRSVDVHMSNIRHKLGALPDGRPCIETVYRLGYQLIKD